MLNRWLKNTLWVVVLLWGMPLAWAVPDGAGHEVFLNKNVGIGTLNPQAKVELVGVGTTSGSYALVIRDASKNVKFRVRDDGSIIIGVTTSPYSLYVSGGTSFFTDRLISGAFAASTAGNGAFYFGSGPSVIKTTVDTSPAFRINQGNVGATGDILDLQTNSTTRVAFTYAGNVGIATTVPLAKLVVVGDGAGTGNALEIDDSTYGKKVMILDNGNVGIGSITPAQKLDVNGLAYLHSNVGIGTSLPRAMLDIDGGAYVSGAVQANAYYLGTQASITYDAGNQAIVFN